MKPLHLLLGLMVIVILPAALLAEMHPRHQEQQGALISGWQAFQEGDVVQALAAYIEAADSSPNDASLWYDIGCLYALNGQFGEARNALTRALELNPRLAPAHDAIGQLNEQDGDISLAVESYVTATNLQPSNAKFLWHLTRAHLRLDDDDAARAVLRKLLLVKPDDVMAHHLLGVLELRNSSPDRAITEFSQVVAQDPDHVRAWNGLALAYTRIGEFKQAASALEQAHSLDPDNARTHSNLGVLAASQEHWAQARSAWQRALELEPGLTPAVQNLNELDAASGSPNTITDETH